MVLTVENQNQTKIAEWCPALVFTPQRWGLLRLILSAGVVLLSARLLFQRPVPADSQDHLFCHCAHFLFFDCVCTSAGTLWGTMYNPYIFPKQKLMGKMENFWKMENFEFLLLDKQFNAVPAISPTNNRPSLPFSSHQNHFKVFLFSHGFSSPRFSQALVGQAQ